MEEGNKHLQHSKNIQKSEFHDDHNVPVFYLMILTEFSCPSCLSLSGHWCEYWLLTSETKERWWIWTWVSWPACKYLCLPYWQRLLPCLFLKMFASPSLQILQWPYITRCCEWLSSETTAILGRSAMTSCNRFTPDVLIDCLHTWKGGESHRPSLEYAAAPYHLL